MTDQPEKHAGGRPSEYDQATADRICAHIARTGTGFETACNLEGITESGGRRWRVAHPQFARAWEKARATKRLERAEQLDGRCADKDTTAIIFSCKTTGEFNDRAGQEAFQAKEGKGKKKRRVIILRED